MGPLYRGAPPPGDDEPMPDFGRSLPTAKELSLSALVTTVLMAGVAAAGATDLALLFGLPILFVHAVYVVPVFRPIVAKRRTAAAGDELAALAARGADRGEPLR